VNGRRWFVTVVFAPVLLGCGGPAPPKPTTTTTPTSDGPTTSLVAKGAPVDEESRDAPDAETPEEIFSRLQSDLVACYERGKKAAPKMGSGKVTLNVAIGRDGNTTCVVPSDDTGLTQEVEDCMGERVARESFKSNGGTWATEIPVIVKGGKLSLGPAVAAAPALETVETHGLPDSAHEVVEALLPELHGCTEGIDKSAGLRVVHVGARVGKDGRVECALASSASPLPAKVRECAAGAIAQARFPAPRSAVGLVSVPVKVLSRK
jgi:hypothetical protein